MLVLDVNLLIALHRADHIHHATAQQWWESLADELPALFIPDIVWVGFLRIVTNSRAFAVPTDMPEAVAFVQAMRQYPQLATVADSNKVLDTFSEICTQDQVHGNLVTDAWIAACAKTFGATVISFDRDFLRFRGLKVQSPEQTSV
jgi:toxin-antitoxin system PIN domain toxin